jgi:hypothetical protein
MDVYGLSNITEKNAQSPTYSYAQIVNFGFGAVKKSRKTSNEAPYKKIKQEIWVQIIQRRQQKSIILRILIRIYFRKHDWVWSDRDYISSSKKSQIQIR